MTLKVFCMHFFPNAFGYHVAQNCTNGLIPLKETSRNVAFLQISTHWKCVPRTWCCFTNLQNQTKRRRPWSGAWRERRRRKINS